VESRIFARNVIAGLEFFNIKENANRDVRKGASADRQNEQFSFRCGPLKSGEQNRRVLKIRTFRLIYITNFLCDVWFAVPSFPVDSNRKIDMMAKYWPLSDSEFLRLDQNEKVECYLIFQFGGSCMITAVPQTLTNESHYWRGSEPRH
jgi:hypothetical protein